MTKLSPTQVRQYAQGAGWTGTDLETAVAVAWAESGGDTEARNVNTDMYASVDRGLWQINNHYHPDVSDLCAYDPQCCAQAAYQIWAVAGRAWTPWATYNSGVYQQYMGISTGSSTPTGTENILAKFYTPAVMTQGYGVPEMGNSANGMHSGIDYGQPLGTDIPALVGGTVIAVKTGCPVVSGVGDANNSCGGGFGNHPTIQLNDGSGRTMIYGHMQSVAVKVGDNVIAGQIIGKVGMTGWTSGPHVHVELDKPNCSGGGWGCSVDPSTLINQAVSTGAAASGSSSGSGFSVSLSTDMFNAENMLQLSYGLNTQTSMVESVEGIATAIYGAEQFRPWASLNPIGSVTANFRALTLRALVVFVGIGLLIMAGVALMNTPAGQSAKGLTSTAGSIRGVSGGGAEAPTMGAEMAEGLGEAAGGLAL